MTKSPRTLTIGLIAAALFVGACGGGGDSVAGTYNCAPEGATDAPGEVWELLEDGTLTITPDMPGATTFEGTWTAEGDQVIIHFEGSDDPFNIEGDRLVSAGPPSPEGRYVCTRAS